MKIIVCGPAIDEEQEKRYEGSSPAAGKFLNNMISAFRGTGHKVDRAMYIPYPINDGKSATITTISDGILVEKDRFVLPSVIAFRSLLKKMIAKGDIVIFYNISYHSLGLVNCLIGKGAIPVLLLADYTDFSEEQSIARKILAFFCKKDFISFPYIVFLGDCKNLSFSKDVALINIRGGINFSLFDNVKVPVIDKKLVFMYAGLLSPVTGVDILMEAIKKTKLSEVRFVFSGKGELSEEIKKLSQIDDRVEYLGYIDDMSYYNSLNDANVFINPRNMKLKQNENNFPSKVLDYLATGRIIISSKFSGFEEFSNEMIWFDGDSDSLMHTIEQVYDDYSEIYGNVFAHNREYSKQFDWNHQVRKILELVSSDK